MDTGRRILATGVLVLALLGAGLLTPPARAASRAPIGQWVGGGVLDDPATPAEGDLRFSLSIRFYADGSADGHFTFRLDTGETYRMEAERGGLSRDRVSASGLFTSWSFATRCQGCGNPWLGDISAPSGLTDTLTIKLYSVTGQPTPVGGSTTENYKLQSGFIYSSQQ